MRLQDLFPTFAKLLGKNSPCDSSNRSAKTHRPYRSTRQTQTHRPLNGLNEENELDQYEVYKLDVMTGGDVVPDTYKTWE